MEEVRYRKSFYKFEMTLPPTNKTDPLIHGQLYKLDGWVDG